MFENFSPPARLTIDVARTLAAQQRAPSVGTDHVVVALTTAGDQARAMLAAAGVSRPEVYQRLHHGRMGVHSSRRPSPTDQVFLSVDLRRAIHVGFSTMVEASAGTTLTDVHLLWGVLNVGDSDGYGVLSEVCDVTALRTAVSTYLTGDACR